MHDLTCLPAVNGRDGLDCAARKMNLLHPENGFDIVSNCMCSCASALNTPMIRALHKYLPNQFDMGIL
jgi:hypothetical protein